MLQNIKDSREETVVHGLLGIKEDRLHNAFREESVSTEKVLILCTTVTMFTLSLILVGFKSETVTCVKVVLMAISHYL